MYIYIYIYIPLLKRHWILFLGGPQQRSSEKEHLAWVWMDKTVTEHIYRWGVGRIGGP